LVASVSFFPLQSVRFLLFHPSARDRPSFSTRDHTFPPGFSYRMNSFKVSFVLFSLGGPPLSPSRARTDFSGLHFFHVRSEPSFATSPLFFPLDEMHSFFRLYDVPPSNETPPPPSFSLRAWPFFFPIHRVWTTQFPVPSYGCFESFRLHSFPSWDLVFSFPIGIWISPSGAFFLPLNMVHLFTASATCWKYAEIQ